MFQFFPSKICLTIVLTLFTAVFRTSDLVLKLVFTFTVSCSLQKSLCWYNPFIKKCITITELVVTFFKKFRISLSPYEDKAFSGFAIFKNFPVKFSPKTLLAFEDPMIKVFVILSFPFEVQSSLICNESFSFSEYGILIYIYSITCF